MLPVVVARMWTLCLTHPQYGRKVVQIEPRASLSTLHQVAEEQYQQPVSSLKYGFPPQPLALHPPSSGGSYPCIQDVLKNQDRIQVEFQDGKNTEGTDPTTSNRVTTKTKATAKDKNTTIRRPQRAAAQKATENMPSIIRAQEEAVKATGTKRPRNTPAPGQGSSTNKKPSTGSHVTPKFPSSSVGEGRRLADGVVVVAATTTSRRTTGTRRGATSSSSSQQESTNMDMSTALLGALNHSGKMDQVLRKGMKNAVQSSYETSRAFSRLAAIQAKTYTMTLLGGETVTSISVKYQGSVDKTKITETVDCIPQSVLEEVLKGIYVSNQEALRPENLSLLSPRVTWSLVRIFPNYTNFADMYKGLFPDLNWDFLRRRAEQLSEKAQENLRQQQQQQKRRRRKGQEDDDDDDEEDEDGEQALEAVAAVEHAMEHLHQYTATERKARLARAAMSRWNASVEGNESTMTSTTTTTGNDRREWTLINPTEPDIDELQECILQAGEENLSGDISTLSTRLMEECQIHNWRELALVVDPTNLVHKLGETMECIQLWIEYAQGKSVEEIIVEICDGNIDAVELLTEKARSGTPKDLAVWRSIPHILHQCISSGSNTSSRGTRDDMIPTIHELRKWSHRAYSLLQDLEWLNWYATPVE